VRGRRCTRGGQRTREAVAGAEDVVAGAVAGALPLVAAHGAVLRERAAAQRRAIAGALRGLASLTHAIAAHGEGRGRGLHVLTKA
jgi:hypothetical protein